MKKLSPTEKAYHDIEQLRTFFNVRCDQILDELAAEIKERPAMRATSYPTKLSNGKPFDLIQGGKPWRQSIGQWIANPTSRTR